VEDKKVRKVIDNPYHIARIVHILLRIRQTNQLDETKKCVWLCALDSYKGILDIELLYESDKEVIDINTKDLSTIPIHVGAEGIIIVVKNLSATTIPSEWDQVFKKILLEASELIGLPLLDHLIINKKGYYSLKAAGLL
jgi:DNA repair protein RadC